MDLSDEMIIDFRTKRQEIVRFDLYRVNTLGIDGHGPALFVVGRLLWLLEMEWRLSSRLRARRRIRGGSRLGGGSRVRGGRRQVIEIDFRRFDFSFCRLLGFGRFHIANLRGGIARVFGSHLNFNACFWYGRFLRKSFTTG